MAALYSRLRLLGGEKEEKEREHAPEVTSRDRTGKGEGKNGTGVSLCRASSGTKKGRVLVGCAEIYYFKLNAVQRGK